MRDGKIKYNVVDGFDYVVDEKANASINVRMLTWGDKPIEDAKLDIRKWHITEEGEIPGKGFSFLTEEGPHTLVETMAGLGFGHTKNILDNIKDREDFRPALNSVLGEGDEFYDSTVIAEEEKEFYDPREALF